MERNAARRHCRIRQGTDAAPCRSAPPAPRPVDADGEVGDVDRIGLYTLLQVSFRAARNEPVAALAREHLARLSGGPGGQVVRAIKEVQWFLQDLAMRTGPNPGPKGGLCLWGIIGNSTMAEWFVDELRPFWFDLLASDDDNTDSDDHILVFCQKDINGPPPSVFQIGLTEAGDALEISRFDDLPFSWNRF